MGFSENLEIFHRFSPQIAEKINTVEVKGYEYCNSENNSLNIRKVASDCIFYIHSIQNPQIEAELWFNSLSSVDEIDTIVVFGVGLGYYYYAAKAWLKKYPEKFLIFIEHDTAVIRLFLETEQAVEILGDPQVILMGIDSKFLENKTVDFSAFNLISKILINGTTVFTEIKSYRTVYDAMWTLLKKSINFYLRDLNWKFVFYTPSTLEATQKNTAANLFALTESKAFFDLKNAFQGIPAVICGAGPSIESDIEIIKKNKNCALFFGAGTGMNVLNKNQFFPHFGAGMDPFLTSASRLLTNYAYEIPYCFVLKFNHEAVDLIHGEKLFIPGTDVYGIDGWFEKELGLDKWEKIDYRISTTHMCLLMAKMLGCDPIILVGVDLAYTDKQRYSDRVTAHPLDPDENQLGINLLPESQVIRSVGIDGKSVLTRTDWMLEANEYAHFAKMNPSIQLINATPRGLSIPEIEHSSLSAIVEKYFKQSWDLDSKVSSAIQNCSPIELSKDTINNAIKKWIVHLEESQRILLELVNNLKNSVENLVKNSNSMNDYRNQTYQNLWKQFIESPVYENFLISINSSYDVVFFHDRFLFDYRKELFTDKEISGRKIEFELGRIYYLDSYIRLEKEIYVAALLDQQLSKKPLSGPERNIQQEGNCKMYYYSSGKLKSRIPYVDGMLDGTVKLYYPDGRQKREVNFKKGLLHGVERFWNRTGQLVLESEYANDRPIGTSKSWHSNGQLKMEKKFYSVSDRYDLQKWNESGVLIENKTSFLDDTGAGNYAKDSKLRTLLKNIKKILDSE